MLSTLDAELIDAWAADGVPFEVVARGIRRAAEAALFDAREGQPGLRSLRACRRQVEAELRKHRGRAAGRNEAAAEAPEEPAHLRRHKKTRAALKKMMKEHPVLTAGVEQLLATTFAEPPADLTQADAREEAADVVLVRALPFDARLPLLREARLLAQEAGGISRRSRKVARRFHRAALLRRRFDLPPYW